MQYFFIILGIVVRACCLNRYRTESKNTRRIECAWNAMNASRRFYVNDKYRIL